MRVSNSSGNHGLHVGIASIAGRGLHSATVRNIVGEI
jgi:hypothetical protein